MGLIENFKRDILRHKGRSAVLGVLFVAMILFSVRAVIQLQPKAATAAVPFNPHAQPINPATSADMEAKLKESQELWKRLREVKPGATPSAIAFTFDPSFYPQPIEMVRKPATPVTPETAPVVATPPAAPMVNAEEIRNQRIREESRSLVLKSTLVGEGITRPQAIINQKLLGVGQEITGFMITAIRAREVELVKERVIVVIKMADGQ
jgi:hypothetical protein